ncbi:hypothetical protein [Haloferula sp. A504]|uniref:hypothetical protein n=1 Tax=Haloferula sp. A504 TaxID=3373601 RepID=UPI0031CA776F|nr:hypothetical protein [Verrucomicrobiaceae bacterium E54]
MRTNRDPGPFLKTEFIPDKRIERRALAELEELGLMPERPEPIKIELFSDLKWGIPEDYDKLPAGVLGYAAFTVNPHFSYSRRRFADGGLDLGER